MRKILLFFLWFLKICHAFSTPSLPKQIPITVISGFLGSGKTTLLKTLLENKEGLKIAVIVNDVASVNVDSKLVSESNSADGMVELQNGCACCSLSEELLGSVSELVTLSDLRGEESGFDHIVVELSGVADPKGVRSQFQEATFYNMPLMERVRLDTLCTVVDCSVYLKHLRSTKTANRTDTPELFYREGEEIPEQQGEDWMEDLPPLLLEALMAGGDKAGAYSPAPEDNNNAVADLLVSQTETADIVLLNKVDLVEDETDLTTIEQIVTSLNSKADVRKTTFGEIALDKVLAVAGGRGAAESGVVDDHRDAIQAAEQSLPNGSTSATQSHSSHEHDHTMEHSEVHDNHHSEEVCEDPDCSDTSHTHSHAHAATHDHSEACEDPGCTDPTHDHSHTAHEHQHSHESGEACTDPDCTDTSHSHSHSHATTLDQLGIGSFVYRARKPFHPQRLVAFLRHLPVSRGLPEKAGDEPSLQPSEDAVNALQRVVRSKGFVWLADSNVAANYWSQSGTAFELQCLGRWWSTLARAEWPPEATATILADFDDPKHEETSDDSVGDRRQEVVFIGTGLLAPGRQEDIVSCLDQCLLNEKEWEEYKSMKSDESSLRSTFVNSVASKMLTY